ncbi:MAG: CvpA family protein [Lachnospiraceae bacterium]|nr:CvpA family protein [Lachnospiraceae bacterium]
MNLLTIIVIGVLVVFAIVGYSKGFVKMLVGILAMALALIGTAIIAPVVNTAIIENTEIRDEIAEGIEDYLDENIGGKLEDVEKFNEDTIIDMFDFPEFLRDMIKKNNTQEKYVELDASNFSEYVGNYVAGIAIAAIAYLVVFLVLYIALRVVFMVLDLVTHLPVLNSLNKLAGAVLGLAQALVYIWIVFAIATACLNSDWGMWMIENIGQNRFLTLIYQYNFVWMAISGMLG